MSDKLRTEIDAELLMLRSAEALVKATEAAMAPKDFVTKEDIKRDADRLHNEILDELEPQPKDPLLLLLESFIPEGDPQ